MAAERAAIALSSSNGPDASSMPGWGAAVSARIRSDAAPDWCAALLITALLSRPELSCTAICPPSRRDCAATARSQHAVVADVARAVTALARIAADQVKAGGHVVAVVEADGRAFVDHCKAQRVNRSRVYVHGMHFNPGRW